MTRPHSPTSTLFLLCSLLVLSVYCADFTFNENGEFTILQFTDFHYCESDDKDNNTLALQRRLMDIVKPDLIMVSGDAVSGFISNATGFYENCWKKFTQPFIDTQTYYAYTLGNHDAESDLNRTQIVQLDKTNPFSILATADSVPDTATFRIPIWSYQNKSHLAAHIWIFDSGSVGCDGISTSWGCILDSHIDWYNQATKQIKKQYGTDVHHVAYYHIPIPEYLDVYNFDEIYGSSNDTVGCPLVNTGFFSAVQKNGDISAMFVGHDHSNDFGGWQGGVEFVYGRKSGYGSYGDVRGARVLKFSEMAGANGTVVVTRQHYIIQEDGDILYRGNETKRPGPIEPTCDTPGIAEVAGLNATTKPKFLDILA